MNRDEETLFQLFGRIHNHIYANEGLSPQDALNEFARLLFLKLESERKPELQKKMLLQDSDFGKIQAGGTIGLMEKLNSLFHPIVSEYNEIFDLHESLGMKESTTAYVLHELQNVDFSRIENDVKGIAFQKFIFSTQRGSRGQFLTPDPIVELAVNFMNPLPGERIIDPACGTGGFLLRCLRHVRSNWSHIHEHDVPVLTGIDINPAILKLARIRMMLEGWSASSIKKADSLSSFSDLKTETGLSLETAHDLVITNPPFGSQGKITDLSFLNRFNFAHVWESNSGMFRKTGQLQNSQSPEVLFIERCMELTVEGGRIAIVLPDGILENRTLKYLRQHLIEHFQILAVVSLPTKTFVPHGTAIKTSILFLRKTEKEELKKLQHEGYRIFFSVVQNVGYVGNKNAAPSYRITTDGTKVLNEDITGVTELYRRFREGKEFEESDSGFTVKYSDLNDRLDAEFYSPEHVRLDRQLRNAGAKPLKELVRIESVRSNLLKNPENRINYVEITGVNPATSEIISSQQMFVRDAPTRATYALKKGQIITEVAGVSTGTRNHASAIVTEEYHDSVCTNGFRVIRPINIDPYYLLYYLRTDLFLSQVRRYLTGAAIPAINEEDLGNILVVLPQQDRIKKISEEFRRSLSLRAESMSIIQGLSEIDLLE